MPAHSTPHDRLFQQVFEDPEVVLSELEAVLPPAIFAQLDPKSLRAMRSRGFSEALPNVVADVWFTVKIAGTEVQVWLLLEHQSRADPWMPLRLLEYQVGAWARRRRTAGAQGLPLVIPIVVLHDPEGRRAPTRFSALYDAPAGFVAQVRPLCVDFTYLCDDLMRTDHEGIAARSGSAAYRLALWLLRTRGDGEPARFEAYRAAFEALAIEDRWALANAFLRYIIEASKDEHPPPLEAARAAAPRFEEEIVTLKDRLLAEGHERGLKQGLKQGRELGLEQGRALGLEQGLEQGRAGLLAQQLEVRFGPLSEALTARLERATSEDIARWATRILTAQSLADVFEDA